MKTKCISNGNNVAPINVAKNPKYKLIASNWADLYLHVTTGAYLIHIPTSAQIIALDEASALVAFERAVKSGHKRW